MRKDYPEDGSPLPRLRDERPGFKGEYDPYSRMARGQITQQNDKKQDVTYIFNVTWSEGKPYEDISVADPAKGWGFDDRDHDKRSMVFRELKGLPPRQAPNARRYARDVATHLRGRYMEDVDFLNAMIESGAAKKIAEGGIPTCWTTLYRDGGWLLTKKDFPALGKVIHEAVFAKEEAFFEEAIGRLAARERAMIEDILRDQEERRREAEAEED